MPDGENIDGRPVTYYLADQQGTVLDEVDAEGHRKPSTSLSLKSQHGLTMAERPLYVRQLEERIAERIRLLKLEQRPIVQELAKVGIYMLEVNEAVLDGEQFRVAAPILLKHLKGSGYSQLTLEILARTFERKDAAPYWRDLSAVYRAQSEEKPNEYGDFTMGLAAALSTAATTKNISEIIDMVRNPKLRDRLLLLGPLKRRRRDPKIASIIEELRQDAYFSKEINSWRPLK